jgi:Sensors of blue-light using FAD
MMIRLLYASRAAQPLNQAVMDGILAVSRKNNIDRGITGILCHSGDVFLQVLEGGRGPVNELYNRITQDARHNQVTLLHYEEATERCFSGWTMGQVNVGKVNQSMLLKYSERPELNPFAVSGAVSMALLQELIATASIGRSS